MSSDSLFIKCKTCDKDISKTARTCPQCRSKQKKLSMSHWLGITFGTVIVIGLLTSPESSRKTVFDTAYSPEKSSSTLEVLQPSDQAEFIEIVTQSAKKFTTAKNELQQSMLKDERRTLLSNAQVKNSVSGWVGTINSLETNTAGKAILSIRISPEIEIKTWNNALSDITSHTLIDKDSDLYSRLSELSVGQRVKFSGGFFHSTEDYFEETSITIDGSMKNPEFLFKFKRVEAIN